MAPMRTPLTATSILALSLACTPPLPAESPSPRPAHTTHPDAQWFGDAGFGLFIHWGIASVRAMNISWPMIPGRPLAEKRIESADERARIVRESDYNLTG